MKTIKTLLVSLSVATSLSAADAQFRVNTRVVELPQKEFAAKYKSDGLLTEKEVQLLLRDISKVEHAKVVTTPSVILPLTKAAKIDLVTDKNIKRMDTEDVESIGQSFTYRLKSEEGVMKLEGNIKLSQMTNSDKDGDVEINTDEMIFNRTCEMDKTILVSKGDKHIFITLTEVKDK